MDTGKVNPKVAEPHFPDWEASFKTLKEQNRLGRLQIPKYILVALNAKQFASLRSKFFPIRSEYMYHGDFIESIGVSEYFESVPEGCYPYSYGFILEDDEVKFYLKPDEFYPTVVDNTTVVDNSTD
jgi:hypothetical protein